MGFPNKFDSKCNDCGAKVKAGRGVCSRGAGGGWITTCSSCAKDVPAATVHARVAGHNVALTTSGRLSDAQFAAYRTATAGGRYAERVNTLTPDLAVNALAQLATVAGLVLDVAPEVRILLDASATDRLHVVQAAEARTATVEAILAQSGRALYPYQREGVAWLAGRRAALLADDMGLGKTIQALTAIPEGVAVIVVCPAVAKAVWQAECARWRTDLRVSVLAGKGALRAPATSEMVVINYDILSDAIPALLPGTVLVLDEAHAVASSKSARTKRVRALSESIRRNGGRVYVLTATPLKNRPPELWSVLEAAGLAREAFGSWSKFRDLFHARDDRWGGTVWGSPSSEVPALLQRVMLRRVKSDVLLDLPAKTHRVLPASIDKATARLCDEAMEEIGLDIGAAVEKLDKSNGLAFRQMSAARAALAKAKIPAMLEIVEEHEASEIPLVVFSAFRAPVDLLASREGWATITGDTSNEERGSIVERFQAGELRGVACTIRAGGVAITLTRASNVLRVDREWNPALNVQAEDRCYRIGQRNAVLVTDLVAEHPLDQRIADVLGEKELLIGASVDAATVQHVAPVAAPVIDWAAIEAQASAAISEAIEAQKAAERFAEGRAKTLAARKAEVAKSQARARVATSAAHRLNEEQMEEDAPRTGPRNAIEAWALDGLRRLATLDPDRAREKNDVGFSAADGHLGHAIAYLGELTSQEWRLAVRLACHYPAQIGRAPVEEQLAA